MDYIKNRSIVECVQHEGWGPVVGQRYTVKWFCFKKYGAGQLLYLKGLPGAWPATDFKVIKEPKPYVKKEANEGTHEQV